jgi:tetratricopeptide (TPR) repeat protein
MDEVACPRCGAHVSAASSHESWVCDLCGYEGGAWTDESKAAEAEAREALARGEAGRAMQLVEGALRADPTDERLTALKAQVESHLAALRRGDVVPEDSVAAVAEAEQYHLQATFVLHNLQANVQVYGSNSMLSGANPADIDLGLEYINRSLELFPENPLYLNTKALLVGEGKGDRDQAKALLERAAKAAPRDINIQNNLKAMSSGGGCFIATAAYGSELAEEIWVLRSWRDAVLLQNRFGRAFVRLYYLTSPPVAHAIRRSEASRAAVRALLTPLIRHLSKTGR